MGKSEDWETFMAEDKTRVAGVLVPLAALGATTLLLRYALRARRSERELQREISERERAEESLQRRNRELAMLHQAGRAFSVSLDQDKVLVAFLDEVCRLLDAVASSVWLIDAATGELVCRQAFGPQSEVVRGWRLAPGEGLAGWVARSGESLIVPDAQSDARHFRDVDQHTGLVLRSFVSVPLRYRQDVIGVLQVVDTQANRFNTANLDLLESLAATAAIALENARLYAEAQRRAAELARALAKQQELDRFRSDFIRNVSHELRTPLALVRGYAELLYSGELGELQPDQSHAASIITRRMRMLTRVMDDFAAIIDIDAEKLQSQPVDLAALVHGMQTDWQATAEQAALTLLVEVMPGMPLLLGDPFQLKRVLDNLLDNAFKFTPTGGSISVRLRHEGQELMLQVADTGIGIPADHLEHIFERFYQIDGSATRRYGGTGLGLALVKEIVEAHGGRVEVRSFAPKTGEAGGGSAFTIYLPLEKAHPDAVL
jgi:signal transduction histidine kinase